MRKKKYILTISIAILTMVSGCGAVDKGDSNSSPSGSMATESKTKSAKPESVATESATASASESAEVKPTESTTNTDETTPDATGNEQEKSDFSSIDGDWYIDGDINAAHITINSSGEFTSYYVNGSVESTGYVKHETKESEDGVNNWYVLYTDDGNEYLSFIDDGSEKKLDFYVGNDNHVHYVLTSGIGGLADDGRGKDEIFVSENYIGTWNCERATLLISENDDGTYTGKITWADSAFAYVEWVYTLTYDTDSQSLICNDNATKTYYQYNDESTDPTVTSLYTNGSGSFCLSNNTIIWNDMKENRGEDMKFVRYESE